MMDLVHEAVRLFDTLAPLIKHPDFIAEAEWRLVSDPVDLKKRPIRLREGKTAIVGPNCQHRRALTFPILEMLNGEVLNLQDSFDLS